MLRFYVLQNQSLEPDFQKLRFTQSLLNQLQTNTVQTAQVKKDERMWHFQDVQETQRPVANNPAVLMRFDFSVSGCH